MNADGCHLHVEVPSECSSPCKQLHVTNCKVPNTHLTCHTA
jgi:hypothetical protein